jgi:hypothetical protein
MPWSFWVVAAVVIAAMVPQIAQIIAFFSILAGGVVAALVFRPSNRSDSFVSALAEATGINPNYIGMGIIGTLVFAVGLLFLIAGARNQRERVFLHAGILMLGFLLASIIAVHRMPSSFGN